MQDVSELPAIVATRRTIDGMNAAINDPFDRPIMTGEIVLTVRAALLLALLQHKAQPIEALHLFTLAQAVRKNRGDSMSLSVEDYAALKAVIEKNPSNWGAYVYGAVLGHLP